MGAVWGVERLDGSAFDASCESSKQLQRKASFHDHGSAIRQIVTVILSLLWLAVDSVESMTAFARGLRFAKKKLFFCCELTRI